MRILVVEDEERIARFLVKALQRGGHEPHPVSSAEEALDALAADGFDMVTVDLGLPGLDGFGLLRTMRERGQMTPAIVITAKSDVDPAAAVALGARALLTKPVPLQTLLEGVARAAARSSQPDLRQ